MRVLLTGATGFVGSHVTRLLVREKCDVHVLVRPGADDRRVADVRSHVHLIPGDILDTERCARTLESVKPEICIHCAWNAKPGEYLATVENIPLMTATVAFARCLADIGCRRFVGVGTCFEYDTEAGYLSESAPLRPAFLYSAAKASTFMMLNNLPLGNMKMAWARLFYLYGPFENEHRLVPSVIRALLRGEEAQCTPGEQVRDFLHVEDVASALWAVALSSIEGAVNVGCGEPVTVARLVTTIAEILERSHLLKLGARQYADRDPQFVCANTQRLRAETPWRRQFDLHDGLLNTINWWRTQEA